MFAVVGARAVLRRAPLAVVLWRAGAIGNDGTVQPLDEWVR